MPRDAQEKMDKLERESHDEYVAMGDVQVGDEDD
ncbi:hypothetical protein J2752_001974 [Halarchaeum rubridurum]|uniref:Uncharacterized protein n=1 Tax=Halarchaeum rubridurum TaxID=489911 RepID=A0A8T4GR83_9EURY|nr:hypothetical protein [Halarchaeum rubridurum]